jgi:hypothetical protein
MKENRSRIAVPLLALGLVVLIGVTECPGEGVRGRVTSLFSNGIEIDVGSDKGVQIGDTGRVYYTVLINDRERPVYVAGFKIIQLSARSSVAEVDEKAADIGIGFLAEVTVRKGELEIRSEPSGAKLVFDGDGVGQTPMVLTGIPLGIHTLTVTKEGYAPYEERVELKGTDRKTIMVSLRRREGTRDESEPKTGELVIRTEPPGAAIQIDGRPAGSSPYTNRNMSPGTVKVNAEKEGYQPWEMEVAVEASKKFEMLVYLKPAEGSLEFVSEPSGARVSLDGREIGDTPLTVSRVSSGEHTVRITKDEYIVHEERIDLKGAERRTIQALLKKTAGELLVSTEPEDAEIYIDGKAVGRSPYENKLLSPGSHKVKIVKEGYQTWEREVVIRDEKRVEVLTQLNPKKRESGPVPAQAKTGASRETEPKGPPKALKTADLAKKKCEAPAWKVGDRWTYRKTSGDGWSQEVVDLRENAYILKISGHPELEAFDRKTMNQLFLVGKNGERVSNADNPFKRLLDFPLSVGKRWSYSTRSRVPASGQSAAEVVLTNEFKVEGVEEVRTSAGTFSAYRILHQQEAVSSVPRDPIGRDSGWVRYWYAPDAKTWIKREFEKTPFWLGAFQDAELVSHELK